MDLSDGCITDRISPNILQRNLDTLPLVQYHIRTKPKGHQAASRCSGLPFLFPVLVIATSYMNPVLSFAKCKSYMGSKSSMRLQNDAWS